MYICRRKLVYVPRGPRVPKTNLAGTCTELLLEIHIRSVEGRFGLAPFVVGALSFFIQPGCAVKLTRSTAGTTTGSGVAMVFLLASSLPPRAIDRCLQLSTATSVPVYYDDSLVATRSIRSRLQRTFRRVDYAHKSPNQPPEQQQ